MIKKLNYTSLELEKLYQDFGSQDLHFKNAEKYNLLLYALSSVDIQKKLSLKDWDYLIKNSDINYVRVWENKKQYALGLFFWNNYSIQLLPTQIDYILENTNFKKLNKFSPLILAFMLNRYLNLSEYQFDILINKSDINRLNDKKNALFYYLISKKEQNIILNSHQISALIEKSKPIRAGMPHCRKSNLLTYALAFSENNELNLTSQQWDMLYKNYSLEFLKELDSYTPGLKNQILKTHTCYIEEKKIIEEKNQLSILIKEKPENSNSLVKI